MALANNGRKLNSKLLTLTSTSKNRLYLLAVAHRCAAAHYAAHVNRSVFEFDY